MSFSSLSIFHSAPIAKRCECHVIITFGRKLHQHLVVLIQGTSKMISKGGELYPMRAHDLGKYYTS